MATLTAAVFAQQVVRNDSRIAAISNVAWVIFGFEAPGGQTFSVATEVKSMTGRLLSFESRLVTAPPSGTGECVLEVSFPVPTVGPYSVSLTFEAAAVWRQTVFFSLSKSVH